MKAFVISRKNRNVWTHYAELAVISGLRILKSLKEAKSGDERLYTRDRHFIFEDKNSFGPV